MSFVTENIDGNRFSAGETGYCVKISMVLAGKRLVLLGSVWCEGAYGHLFGLTGSGSMHSQIILILKLQTNSASSCRLNSAFTFVIERRLFAFPDAFLHVKGSGVPRALFTPQSSPPLTHWTEVSVRGFRFSSIGLHRSRHCNNAHVMVKPHGAIVRVMEVESINRCHNSHTRAGKTSAISTMEHHSMVLAGCIASDTRNA